MKYVIDNRGVQPLFIDNNQLSDSIARFATAIVGRGPALAQAEQQRRQLDLVAQDKAEQRGLRRDELDLRRQELEQRKRLRDRQDTEAQEEEQVEWLDKFRKHMSESGFQVGTPADVLKLPDAEQQAAMEAADMAGMGEGLRRRLEIIRKINESRGAEGAPAVDEGSPAVPSRPAADAIRDAVGAGRQDAGAPAPAAPADTPAVFQGEGADLERRRAPVSVPPLKAFQPRPVDGSGGAPGVTTGIQALEPDDALAFEQWLQDVSRNLTPEQLSGIRSKTLALFARDPRLAKEYIETVSERITAARATIR